MPVMLYPSGRVASLGVMMCPVDHTPFRIPFIFSVELNGIAGFEGDDSTGQINIMGNQKRLPGTETNDKPLMPAAIIVIRENPDHFTGSLNLNITLMIVVSRGQLMIGGTNG